MNMIIHGKKLHWGYITPETMMIPISTSIMIIYDFNNISTRNFE